MATSERPSTPQDGPSTPSAERSLGGEFVAALADRDAQRLESCLGPEVRLRALVPSGLQEERGPAAVARRFMGWFEDAETVQVLDKSEHSVVDRLHLRYRFRELYSDGASDLIEQEAFCDLEEGRIVSIDLLCSGHLPQVSSPDTAIRRFDAGDLGCGSGLPQEFRRLMQAIPMGSTLEVSTHDPSAREDLPSLARLLGHRVVSVDDASDGSTVVSVQRGR